jgi:hypothetical protein
MFTEARKCSPWSFQRRMRPPDQGLHPAEVAVADVDLRLVEHGDLLAPSLIAERGVQLAQQRDAALGKFGRLAHVEDGSLAGPSGVGRGELGLHEQRPEVLTVAG